MRLCGGDHRLGIFVVRTNQLLWVLVSARGNGGRLALIEALKRSIVLRQCSLECTFAGLDFA